jgi:hypothetical protein
MTQAINLANFSNSLDTSGGVPPSQLNAPVPISKGGTNATTAAGARTNLDVAQAVYSVPSGGIIMWSGSVASIPTGWLLCDGTSGTPNLRDKFIVGAGSTYAPAATGGSADAIVVSHNHTASSTSTVTDPGHRHTQQLYYSGGGGGGGADVNVGASTSFTSWQTLNATTGISVSTSTTNTATGASGTNANLPPYYALAFIMKS